MDNLLKKFIEFAFGNAIALILGFISSPIITRIISTTEFGKFSMFNTVTNLILLILLLGLDQSYMRFFYDENSNSRKLLFKYCIKIPLLFNLIISICLIMFFKPISKFIIGEYSVFIIIIVIIQNTFNIFSRFILLQIRMNQKGNLYSIIQVISKSIYILSVPMLFYILKNSYKTLVYSIIIANFITIVTGIFVERRKYIKIFTNFKDKNKLNTSKKELLKYGIPLVFSMSIMWIFQSTDKIFIKIYNGYSQLGIYSSALSLIALLNAFQGIFTTFWVPVANERYKKNSKDSCFFSKINDIISLFMILASILLIIFKDFLILLLGSTYREATFIFPFLVFMPVMCTISETTVIGINFSKKTYYHIIISICAALINVLGNFLLVPQLGPKGAAISTGISYIVFFSIRTTISKKLYEVNYHLLKLYACLFMILILAVYSTFKNLDIILVILGTIAICITLFLYKKILFEFKDRIYQLRIKNNINQ